MKYKFILISKIQPMVHLIETDVPWSIKSQFVKNTWDLVEISDKLYSFLYNGNGVEEQSEPTKYSQIY